mgnify:CR=1 FL=1
MFTQRRILVRTPQSTLSTALLALDFLWGGKLCLFVRLHTQEVVATRLWVREFPGSALRLRFPIVGAHCKAATAPPLPLS